MGIWAAIGIILCLALAALLLQRPGGRLPPGPPAFYVLTHFFWLSSTLNGFQLFLGNLWSTFGPVVTIKLFSFTAVMVADRDLAHKMLVQHGAVFADRVPLPFALQYIGSNTNTVATARYGPLWRAFRRNLVTTMLSPARIRQRADVRGWFLQILLIELRKAEKTPGSGPVFVREIFQNAMFFQQVFLVFGEKLDAETVRKIRATQEELIGFVGRLNIFASIHKVSAYLFRETYSRIRQLRLQQREIFLPLIVSRREKKESGVLGENAVDFCYVDNLLELEIQEEEGRKLTDEEIISLCSEFINAGADSIATALEWTMANVVKHSEVQQKLAKEVEDVKTEDDLRSKPYLKAVVLEGLRRHPPFHVLLPHAVTEEITVDGYSIPRGATINFGVTKMNMDADTWRDPLEFRPERFLPGGEGEGVDVACRRKIRMMTFGAGRRLCPGMRLALFLLEYFVANLVKEFRWEEADGGVDLTEKPELTVAMSRPLRARILSRRDPSLH